MAYFWFILAGCLCFVSSKEIAKDDMEIKFDALVDRIEVLENSVRSQNLVIQSQQDIMAAMKETINTQAEELKTQRESIERFQDVTNKLRLGVKRLERRVKSKRTSISAESAHQKVLTSDPFDNMYDRDSTESKDKELATKSHPVTFDDELEQSKESQAKQRQSTSRSGKSARKTVPAIKNEVRRLLTPVQATQVAFTAYLDKTLTHLGINHKIPFDKVLLNEGNAFNTHTGIFLCPQSGVYLFSFSIESNNHGPIVVKLVVDGKNQLYVITDGSGGHFQTAGATSIVRLTSGQSVWVANYNFNDVTLTNYNSFRYTSFSGVLLF